MTLITFHWSCFFDDFFIAGNSAKSLCRRGFALLGWKTVTQAGQGGRGPISIDKMTEALLLYSDESLVGEARSATLMAPRPPRR